MANRNRSRRSKRTGGQVRSTRQRSLWKSTVVLTVPLVTGTAAVTVAVSEFSPAVANASTKPGLLSGILPTSLPTLLPSPKPSPSKSSGSGGLLPSVGKLLPSLLPTSPVPSPSPSPSTGSPPPSSSKHPGHSKSKKHSGGPARKQSGSPAIALPGGLGSLLAGSAGAPAIPHAAVGYALPVPAALVAKTPSLIGEGSPAPSQAQPAGPVTLGVPQGTPVNAVTAGTFKTVGSTIVLTGADGATYTYQNVTGASGSGQTQAGSKLGTSGPGGLTFSISVPDVKGPVDANEAMQAWASGLTVNVRSLPSTIAPATAPTKDQVLLVTDSGARGFAGALSKSLAGPLVAVHTAVFSGRAAALKHASSLARQITASNGSKLMIVSLADGTPADAAALAALLPSGRQLLWVAPPGTTAKQAAAYRTLTASNPSFRVETLPSAVARTLASQQQAALTSSSATTSAASAFSAVKAISNRQATASQQAAPASMASADQLAAGALTASYATTAYRLYTVSSEASTALSWAEQQVGKPYQWGAAGPSSFDCSGLVMDALAQAGVAVPHNANAQWQQTKARTVPATQLQPGDLVFFTGSDGTAANPGHEGIYVGGGQIINAPHTGTAVRFEPLSSISGFVGATDPYAPVGVPGSAALGSAQLAGLAVPSALSQYQAFAQQLSGSTWGPSQFQYLYLLWQRESGWNPAALNPLSGAYGIPQSLPAGKMAASGLDWATDPYTQIIWGIGYISSAYGDPQSAWAHELKYGWY